jgi:cell division protein FtsQ
MIWQRKKKNRRIQAGKQEPVSRIATVLHDPRLRRLTGVTVSILLVMTIAWQILAWLQAMQELTLQRVQVEGQFKQMQRSDLKALLSGYAGENFFDIDVAVIKHQLEQQPWIRAATVRRQWPDSLFVRIVEQTPVARWGERAFITASAEVFYPQGATPQQGFELLPQLNGVISNKHELLTRLNTVRELFAPLGLQVAEMGLDARQAWSIKLNNGLELLLGREQATQRVQRFMTFYPLLLAQQVNDVDAMDLRYPNGFVLRWSALPKRIPLG